MNKLVFKSKDNEMIFHPGYLIKNIMDEEGKDTKGMVQLLGLTEKEITALINAEISITDDMINRIVKNYGTSKELWKNFQNRYDLKIKELRENNQLEDITILTTNENTGVDIVKFFSDKGLKVSHVYDMNKGKNTKKRRNEKWKFRGGTGRLKVCSYHSYKGWQTPNVILVLDSCGSENIVDVRKNVNNAIFISMSRVKPNSMNGQFSFTCFNYLDEYDFLEKVF